MRADSVSSLIVAAGERKREEKWEGGANEKKIEGGGWVQGVRGAWVLRRVGPHTHKARST